METVKNIKFFCSTHHFLQEGEWEFDLTMSFVRCIDCRAECFVRSADFFELRADKQLEIKQLEADIHELQAENALLDSIVEEESY